MPYTTQEQEYIYDLMCMTEGTHADNNYVVLSFIEPPKCIHSILRLTLRKLEYKITKKIVHRGGFHEYYTNIPYYTYIAWSSWYYENCITEYTEDESEDESDGDNNPEDDDNQNQNN
jgi:hypothetical protein